jgi:HTH-type transcriptional repressor of NAD biosynthesis genes
MNNIVQFNTLAKNPATSFKEGAVVGKFAPLTQGHINLINIASTECEHLTVILCYDDKFLSKQNSRDQVRLTLKKRLLWLKQAFFDMPHITIKFIDETNIPAYPNGWAGYAELIRSVYGGTIPQDTAIFSSELEYDENYKKHLPELTHVVVDNDRTQVPISATMIREDLYENWGMLPSVVRKDYTVKICVLGTESSGKTTLVKSLAKLYNTSWVEEYGRTYCEQVLCGDEFLLTSEDYTKIAFHHKTLEEEALKSSNKITFVDSNAFVTEFYHRLNEGIPNSVVTEIAKTEQYDLILYLTDEVPWVSDGLRQNGDKREETKALLHEMFDEFPNIKEKMVTISGDSYKTRLQQSRAEVEKLLEKMNIGH